MSRLTPYQIEALDFENHISLTANAGSGKTFVFAKRFVEIALSKDYNLQNIIAITFTDKAAGELNKRIAKEVEELLLQEKDPVRLRRLKYIRQRLVSANISTIHSFCIELLKEFSPEAGLDANFIPVDPRIANELLELSIDESINIFSQDKELFEDYKYFVRLFGSKSIFRRELVSLIDKRKTILQLKDTHYSKSDEELLSWFAKIFDDEFKLIFGDRIKKVISSVSRINSNVLMLDPNNEFALGIENEIGKFNSEAESKIIFENLSAISELILTKSSGQVKKRGYLKKNQADELGDEINLVEEFYEDFKTIKYDNEEGLTEELILHGRKFLKIFFVIEELYTKRKLNRGYLDFEDILLHSLRLTSNPKIVEQLSEKYKYIMIDEYQDTNDVQYNIFMPVLDNLRKGNLFVVGDEKQSIYMFRDADISIYQQTKTDLKNNSAEAKILNLPHSFRMLPNLAVFTNKLFRNLFDDPKEIFNEVEHSELICAKDSEEKGSIEFLIKTPDNNIDEPILVQRKIIELYNENMSGGFQFGDIAVLCRKRSNFRELEKVFTEAGIPYVVIGGRGFYQQQVVGDLYNYLSFLMDQKNDAALIGILRSPFFMMSDANIYELSREKGSNYFEKMKNYLTHNIYFQNVLKILNEHIIISATHDVSELIRIILNDTGYWALISGKPDSSQQIKNIEKLITIAAGYSSQEFATLYDFIQYLENSINNIEDEGQAVLDEGINAVKLMTIHQSKGLEFRAVILYKSHEYGKNSKLIAKQIEVDKKYGILSKLYFKNNYFEDSLTPPVAGLYNYISAKKHDAELKRLLYVAVTRAIEFLIISGDASRGLRETSFLGLIQKGLNINFDEENYSWSETLKFMTEQNDEYVFYDKDLSLIIPILKEVKEVALSENLAGKIGENKRDINFQKIKDGISREIVSATKIAVFNQCPVKYQLTYELGYSDLAALVKNKVNTFDFKYKEDEETVGYGDLKGRIVHEILDLELEPEECYSKVDLLLEKELTSNYIFDKKEELKKEINNLLQKYFQSQTYKELKTYRQYENEYEIYTGEGDYYLYGIIDKLVFLNDRILIIDYKTDRIEEDEISERGENYISQLMFYANILRKKYDSFDKFELRLVFLNYPDSVFKKETVRNELVDFNLRVKQIINDIRNKNYTANKKHCPSCFYSVSKTKCINEKV